MTVKPLNQYAYATLVVQKLIQEGRFKRDKTLGRLMRTFENLAQRSLATHELIGSFKLSASQVENELESAMNQHHVPDVSLMSLMETNGITTMFADSTGSISFASTN